MSRNGRTGQGICFMETKDLDMHPRLGFQSSQATDSDVQRGSCGTKSCTNAELIRWKITLHLHFHLRRRPGRHDYRRRRFRRLLQRRTPSSPRRRNPQEWRISLKPTKPPRNTLDTGKPQLRQNLSIPCQHIDQSPTPNGQKDRNGHQIHYKVSRRKKRAVENEGILPVQQRLIYSDSCTEV